MNFGDFFKMRLRQWVAGFIFALLLVNNHWIVCAVFFVLLVIDVYVIPVPIFTSLADWLLLAPVEVKAGQTTAKPAAPKSAITEKSFNIRSPANFAICYRLSVSIEAQNEDVRWNERVREVEMHKKLASSYNEQTFLPFLNANALRFHLRPQSIFGESILCEPAVAKADAFFTNGDVTFFRDTSVEELEAKARTAVGTVGGCLVKLVNIQANLFPSELVQSNYSMITNDIKANIEKDERYDAFEENLAVALLKRRLDFIHSQYHQQIDESEFVSIKTEQAGKNIRIAWSWKKSPPVPSFLLGYKKLGGFHKNYFDQTENGTLLVHSVGPGFTIDPLEESSTSFYTFFIAPMDEEQKQRWPVARFQVTVDRTQEAAIEDLVRKIEEKTKVPPFDSDRERFLMVIKSFLNQHEQNRFLDLLRQDLQSSIQTGDLSASEKKRHSGRIDNMLAKVRQELGH